MMQNKFLMAILAILLGGGAVGGYKVVKDNKADVFENSLHPVVRVVDGDTVVIEREIKVRLLGIDAPEKGDCFYAESSDFLKNLIGDKQVRIEKDISGEDRFERLLRYIYLPSDDVKDDDVFVNQLLVKEGYAFKNPMSPDNRYRDLFSSAQEYAKENSLGLWGECDYEEEEAAKLREKNSTPPNPDCAIKGNISEKGYGKIYLLEGCPNYNRVKIDVRKGEQYFCTEKEAREAGFVRSDSCDTTF